MYRYRNAPPSGWGPNPRAAQWTAAADPASTSRSLWDQRAIADIDIRNAERGGDHRRGELGHLAHDQIWSPVRHDRLEVHRSRHELEVGEDLGEEEPALRIADQRGEQREPRRPLGPERLRRSRLERRETRLGGPSHHRITRRERDRVTGRSGSHRQRQQRFEMTRQRPTREQDPRTVGHGHVPLKTRDHRPEHRHRPGRLSETTRRERVRHVHCRSHAGKAGRGLGHR